MQSTVEWRPGQKGGAASVEERSAAACGADAASFHRDLPGLSTFAVQDTAVHHCLFAYAREQDALWGERPWLDRAPLGRERRSGPWRRRRDEYGAWELNHGLYGRLGRHCPTKLRGHKNYSWL